MIEKICNKVELNLDHAFCNYDVKVLDSSDFINEEEEDDGSQT